MKRTILSIISIVFFVVSITIFLIAILDFANSSFSQVEVLNIYKLEGPHLTMFITSGLLLALIGWQIQFQLGLIKFVKLKSLYKEEQFALAISSLLIVMYYADFLSSFQYVYYLTLLVLTPLVLLALIQVVNFFTQMSKQASIIAKEIPLFFQRLKKEIDRYKKSKETSSAILPANQLFPLLHKLVAVSIFSILVFIIIFILGLLFFMNVKATNLLKQKLYISSVNPKTITHSIDLEIIGYNFGWNESEQNRLITSEGSLEEVTWLGDRAKFNIPPSINAGELRIWIEKENELSVVQTSNVVSVNIRPRSVYFPEESDTMLNRAAKKVKRLIFLGEWKLYFNNSK